MEKKDLCEDEEAEEDCEEKKTLRRRNRMLRKSIEIPTELLGGDEEECEGDECAPSDIDRLGSVDIIENMGIMLLFAFILLIVCTCLIAVAIYVRSNPEAKGTYEKIKRKIFWNAFIRYVLQSTLKTQVGAAAVIAVTMGLSKQHHEETKDGEESETSIYAKLAVPAAMLIFFNVAPIVFICILRHNKKQLDTDECRARYG